jgi:hypothetical protein
VCAVGASLGMEGCLEWVVSQHIPRCTARSLM